MPTLVAEDGRIVHQAAAIMLYLAERHGLEDLAPAPDDPVRGAFLAALFYLSGEVQTAYKAYFYPERYSTDAADAARIRARARETLLERWAVVESRLAAAGPFSLGARFSLADIYLAMLAAWFEPAEELRARFAATGRCAALVAARPKLGALLDRHAAELRDYQAAHPFP